MAVRTFCSACGEEYNLADRLAGKTVRCKACGDAFVVQAARPRRAAGSRREERPGRRRRADANAGGSRKLIWILAGSGAAVVLLLGVVLAIVLSPSGGEPAPGEVPGPLAQNQGPKASPVVQPVVKKEEPPKKSPAPPNPGNTSEPKPKIDPPKQPPPAPWRAQPDPGPDMRSGPEKVGKPIPPTPQQGNFKVLYPTTPSPFAFLVWYGQGPRPVCLRVDLRRGEATPVALDPSNLRDEVLSPDGKYLLARTWDPQNAVRKFLRVIPLTGGPEPAPLFLNELGGLDGADFLADEHVLTVHKQTEFRVAKTATVEEVRRYQIEPYATKWALSPGRRLLVIYYPAQQTLKFRRALTGEPVGAVRIPTPKYHGLDLRGLAFAPDGEELACFFYCNRTGAPAYNRLVTVKMATGTLGVDHKFTEDVARLLPSGRDYRGAALEWVPDRSGWLFYGQVWIDYVTGAPIYQKFAFSQGPGVQVRHSRRLIGKDYLALVEDFKIPGQRGQTFERFRLFPLPAEQIAAAVTKVRGSTATALAALPAPHAVDLAAAKLLPAPQGGAPWQVEPDAALASPGPLAAAPIPVGVKSRDVLDVVFSRPDVGQAVLVHSSPINPLSPRRQVRADRLDLTTGKLLGRVALFASEDLEPKRSPGDPLRIIPAGGGAVKVAVSPDGTRLLARHRATPGRIDLWDLQTNKHVVGWLPGAGENAAVDWFAFLDADRVFTAGKGKLILWKMPECRAVYVQEGVRAAPGLSPGRKYVAFAADTGLQVIEAETAARKGRLEYAGVGGAESLSLRFSPDGRELAAAAYAERTFTRLNRWDLTTGTQTTHLSTMSGPLPVACAGPGLLFYGLGLYDAKVGHVWQYSLKDGVDVPANDGPDGRVWFVHRVRGRGGYEAEDTYFLLGQAIPDAQAAPFVREVAAGRARPVLPAGATLQVVMQSNRADQDKFIAQNLRENLQKKGFKIGPSGLTLRVTAEEKAIGGFIPYEIKQGNKREVANVPARVIDVKTDLLDGSGKLLNRQGNVMRPPTRLIIANETAEAAMRSELWSDLNRWSLSYMPPRNLYFVGGQAHALPKRSALNVGE